MADIEIALATVAQLAVVIPGFAALVTVMRRGEGGLRPAERIAFLLMLTMASATVVGALLPFALLPVIGEEAAWRVCSLLLGLTVGLTMVVTARLRHAKAGTEAAPRNPSLLLWTGIVPYGAFSVALTLNYWWASPSVYFGGLLVTLFGAGYLFWYMILAYDRQAPSEDRMRQAASLVLDDGHSVHDVARQLHLDRAALRTWVRKLRTERSDGPSPSQLARTDTGSATHETPQD